MPENLHKSHRNKVFAGVCGGLGEYFNVDATLIRLVWALAVFVGGTGLFFYILAIIIMPSDPSAPVRAKAGNTPAKPAAAALGEGEDGAKETGAKEEFSSGAYVPETDEKRRQIVGLILVGLGGYFLLERLFPFFNLHNWWPAILIIIGVFIIFKGRGGTSR